MEEAKQKKEVGLIRSWKEEEPERGDPLTSALRHAMYHAVEDQLREFMESEPLPLLCSFNKEHTRGEYTTSHCIRSFVELCNAFLKMFSSLQLPSEYDPLHGGFLEKDHLFKDQWSVFHKKRATLRILCRACHLLYTSDPCNNKKKTDAVAGPTLCINDVLKMPPKSKQFAHSWLDIKTWGEKNDKGGYRRVLGDGVFTLFIRDNKWNYAYKNKFGTEKHDSLAHLLEETYRVFGDTIRRYL